MTGNILMGSNCICDVAEILAPTGTNLILSAVKITPKGGGLSIGDFTGAYNFANETVSKFFGSLPTPSNKYRGGFYIKSHIVNADEFYVCTKDVGGGYTWKQLV